MKSHLQLKRTQKKVKSSNTYERSGIGHHAALLAASQVSKTKQFKDTEGVLQVLETSLTRRL